MNSVRGINQFGMRRLDSDFFRVTLRKSVLPSSRVTLIAPRSSEKRAVRRNRIRRRTREWLRKNAKLFRHPVTLDILFKKEAFASTRKLFYVELERTINRVFPA